MRLWTSLIVAAMSLFLATIARADQTPSQATPHDFGTHIDVKPLRPLSVQHAQTLKTLDSYARQTVAAITGRSRFDDQEPIFTMLDMWMRPELWIDRPVIKIKHAPLIQDLERMPGIAPADLESLKNGGRVSLRFWRDAKTTAFLREITSQAAHKIDAVNKVEDSARLFESMVGHMPGFPPLPLIAPAGPDDQRWLSFDEVAGNTALGQSLARVTGNEPPPAVPGYDNEKLASLIHAKINLFVGWREGDANRVNDSIAVLAAGLPAIAPERYPSELKRNAEVLYNKLYKLTLPGAAFYFFAFVFFVMSAIVGAPRLRKVGLGLFLAGFVVHTAGIAIRWWLTEKSTGSWFYSIPIKNQFESVMMSAWFGAAAGIGLEFWKRKGLFGAASSFFGWLALIAIFTVPYVLGINIGNEIGQAAGILMSYWLYIHVTLAVASYALIGMSFLLGLWWIFQRLFGDGVSTPLTNLLDQCNLVAMQMAFWVLGIAIVCGAIWADVSWGRPWGWDPKETFALVTWICYLVIIHIRMVVKKTQREAWTAGLSVVGFFVMLFNWIGVNYFLVGLHSYA